MSDAGAPPLLPEPVIERWQPLRIGLVELYFYDVEEFWFRDGHLLLRGNNGAGKSKVLSLTLPFLFDANLRSERIEPDGDRAKRMEWNLLMGGAAGERRTGYAWIEFGRRDESGNARYLTLGCGMKAVAGKAVEPWYFITPQRIGSELWLTTPEHTALSKDRLASALGERGQLFDNAQAYRRAVDERLFRLGDTRYAALIDTLIQLRQPQLSKQPDEKRLSAALSEALPPLERALLEDVAESFNRLDDLKRELDELDDMFKAVSAFEKRFRIYAQVAARRRAAVLRRAQTEHDNASTAVNAAVSELVAAKSEVERLQALDAELSRLLVEDTARLDALREDPAHQDAKNLDQARAASDSAAQLLMDAQQRESRASERRDRELELSRTRERQAATSRERLTDDVQSAAKLAADTGLRAAHTRLLDGTDLPDGAADLPAETQDRVRREAEGIATERLRQIALLRTRLATLAQAQRTQETASAERAARADEFDDASAAVEERQRERRRAAAALLESGRAHLAQLTQLRIENAGEVLAELEDWIETSESRNPLRRALEQAHRLREQALAASEAANHQQQRLIDTEHATLRTERESLNRGDDRVPPAPHTRGAEVRRDRPGAPLWQLVDFTHDHSAAERAGLEAALQASGLLDAWVTPAGEVIDPLTQDLLLVARAPVAGCTLRQHLHASIPADGAAAAVSAHVIDAILDSIAAGEQDEAQAEAWVSAQGAFRLGPAQGAWSKPQAEFIGHAAREAARRTRLAEIVQRLAALDEQTQMLLAQLEELEQVRLATRGELDAVPSDEPLLRAQAAFIEAERVRRGAQERLAAVEARLTTATAAVQRARDALELDAADLRLPTDVAALDTLASSVQDYRRAAAALAASLREHRRDRLELAEQTRRESTARSEQEQAQRDSERQARVAQQMRTRYLTLRDAVGDLVETLQRKLAEAKATSEQHQSDREQTHQQQIKTSGRHEAAIEKDRNARERLNERVEERRSAILVLHAFTASGLMRQALAQTELPATDLAWGVELGLNLARRAEQELSTVAADDTDWQRIQNSIGSDLAELQRAMSAQGHEAVMEVADDCMRVHIVYRQRPEPPDALREQLDRERGERRQQLSAREREILENHLQQEIAARLQELIQETERRVAAINVELERRPTSTGVRFRLAWQPVETDEAFSGLSEARKRLMRTRSEAWSNEDRRVVGEFLKLRIDAERQREDQTEGAGVQLEILNSALDYRRWHRFAVQRKLGRNDPDWRPLSGPASSGEKALGLTVPLFAAASSFYRSADVHAPRLVLLDEAFAGIDTDARRHCMALIREFDLDFVMTSESEWGCYAELPGVAISHLVRREGADAVFVSRWNWDGRERRVEPDPERRFPSATTA